MYFTSGSDRAFEQLMQGKRNMGGILGARRVGGQWYNFIKKKQPPEPAS